MNWLDSTKQLPKHQDLCLGKFINETGTGYYVCRYYDDNDEVGSTFFHEEDGEELGIPQFYVVIESEGN